jgi:hypothetical protein
MEGQEKEQISGRGNLVLLPVPILQRFKLIGPCAEGFLELAQ